MSDLITGAKALIAINGSVAGYATGIVVQEAIINGRVETLGTVDTREIEPISRIVTGSISFMRIFNKSVDNEFLTNENTNLVQRSNDILTQPDDFDIIIYSVGEAEADAAANPIYTVKGCKPSSQTIAVDRNSFMGLQVTFDALYLVKNDEDNGTDIDGYTLPAPAPPQP
jgi:hypothetical protein